MTFEALRVPAHFFFYEWPGYERLRGKWKVELRDGAYFLALDFPHGNDSRAAELTMVLPWGGWEEGQNLDLGEPLEWIGVAPKPGERYGVLMFGLTRQK